MRIFYITQTFPPEPGATKRPLKQAVCLQKFGHKVTILTTMPSYPLGRVFEGYRGRLLIREKVEGVDVIRVWSIPASNTGRFWRIISHLSFALAATLGGMLIHRHDLVIASLPNIGTEIAGILVARLKKSTLLLELRDLIPDNLVLIHVSEKSLFARILFVYFKWVYLLVDLIAVPGKNMVIALIQRGVAPNRILLLPHAADPESFTINGGQRVRQTLHLDGKFVALYAGSFSPYYDVPNLVTAACQLRERLPQLHMLLIGTGPDWKAVERIIKDASLDNTTLIGPVAPDEICPYLQAADLLISSVVGWKTPKSYENYIHTKICEYLMVGRPLIAVENVPVMGNILREIGCGFSVPARHPEALADGIAFFALHEAEAFRCGSNARQYAQTYLRRELVMQRFHTELLQKIEKLEEYTT